MKRLLPVLVVLIVMVGLGVGIAMYVRRRHRQANRPWAAVPCHDGLAFADNTIEPTLKISVLETSCEDQSAGVHFSVTNVGTAQITYFKVRAIYTYDHYVDDGAEVGTGPLAPGQSDDSYFGMGPPTLASRKPVGELRSITLITSLLEFADGRKWRRPSIHEPAPQAAGSLEFTCAHEICLHYDAAAENLMAISTGNVRQTSVSRPGLRQAKACRTLTLQANSEVGAVKL